MAWASRRARRLAEVVRRCYEAGGERPGLLASTLRGRGTFPTRDYRLSSASMDGMAVQECKATHKNANFGLVAWVAERCRALLGQVGTEVPKDLARQRRGWVANENDDQDLMQPGKSAGAHSCRAWSGRATDGAAAESAGDCHVAEAEQRITVLHVTIGARQSHVGRRVRSSGRWKFRTLSCKRSARSSKADEIATWRETCRLVSPLTTMARIRNGRWSEMRARW
jgi:hypothetical protein